MPGPATPAPQDEWIEIGRIGRPHGVRGGIHLNLHNDDGDLLREGLSLRLGPQAREVVVASVYGPALIKLEGVQGREAAAALTGQRVCARRSDFPEPDDDEAYLVDLIGIAVTAADGHALGTVEGISDNGAQPLLQLRTPHQRGLVEVPFVPAFIVDLNVDEGVLVLDLPDGLVEGEPAVAAELPEGSGRKKLAKRRRRARGKP